MTHELTETFSHNGIEAGMTVHVPDGTPRSCVLYLHGGGLLYGERDDLPRSYIEMFLTHGHALVCADYPLAPEMPLRGIHAFVDALWSLTSAELAPRLGTERVFIFGRSAGAYLALTLSARICGHGDAQRPEGVIDFYGYDDASDPALAGISEHYRSFPLVSRDNVQTIIGVEPVTSGPMAKRYALYVYARQQGAWNELLGTDAEESEAYAISDAQASAMPPVFYAASTDDQDVPYAVSKKLARRLRARMVTLYGLEHDFDRDATNPAGRDAYEKLLAWMDGILD